MEPVRLSPSFWFTPERIALSRLHHTSRGLDAQTLAVLTVIHNFDIRRGDGTTPAQRLFGHYAREPI